MKSNPYRVPIRSGSSPRYTHSRRGRNSLLVALVGLLFVLPLVTLGVVGWIGSERALHPTPTPLGESLADHSFQVEPVQFASRDGTHLAGWFVAGSRPETILVVHGFRGSKESELKRTAMLHEAGFNVLAIDLRNSGESGGDITTLGYLERYDVAGAIDYLLTRSDVEPERIGALGTSMGAAAILMAAAETDGIQAMVIEGGYESLESVVEVGFEHFLDLPAFPFAPTTVWIAELRSGISAGAVRPIDAVPLLGARPVLYITGLDSTEIRYQDSINLFRAGNGPRQLWLIPGGRHADGIEVVPEEYAQRVTAFLDAALNARALPTVVGSEVPTVQ